MFSYRHAFHAGNHADVLKHATLVAVLQHLTQKEGALSVVDTHAGAGLYKLDTSEAAASGEALEGIQKLLNHLNSDGTVTDTLPELLKNYLIMLAGFNQRNGAGKGFKLYPGSPLIAGHLLRTQDRVMAFEVHPTDHRVLRTTLAQATSNAKLQMDRRNGFEGVVPLLPPVSRRGLVICDPSYELKTDYADVVKLLGESLTRFATGSVLIWYPIVGRSEAHDLPRKLKNAADKAGKDWLHATLQVRAGSSGQGPGGGLGASGVFVLNPPYTLKPQLEEALPVLVKLLGQDKYAAQKLEAKVR
jgi:23S rRNA (adenine2030-N6)-methyltransferase